MTARVALPTEVAESRLIAILRGLEPAPAREAIAVLAASGVRALEVTIDSPDALELVGAARERGLLAGSGTIRRAQDARRAIAAGAAFLVCPHTDEGLVEACAADGMPVLAGAATATEALRAWDAGAAAVKLFPAAPLGAGYLRALREPLPDIPFVPTGGVSAASAPEWLAAGAVAVAVGGEIARAAHDGALSRVASALVAATAGRP